MRSVSYLFLLSCFGFTTAAIAQSNCLKTYNCRPYDEARDAETSILEIRQRGSVCYQAAEALPGHARHRCYETLDDAAMELFNVASYRQSRNARLEYQRRMEEYRQQCDDYYRRYGVRCPQ